MKTNRRSLLKSMLAASVSLTLGAKMSMERVMGATIGPVSLSGIEPTSGLTQNMLDDIYRALVADGGAASVASPDGTPVFVFSVIDRRGRNPVHDAFFKS